MQSIALTGTGGGCRPGGLFVACLDSFHRCDCLCLEDIQSNYAGKRQQQKEKGKNGRKKGEVVSYNQLIANLENAHLQITNTLPDKR